MECRAKYFFHQLFFFKKTNSNSRRNKEFFIVFLTWKNAYSKLAWEIFWTCVYKKHFSITLLPFFVKTYVVWILRKIHNVWKMKFFFTFLRVLLSISLYVWRLYGTFLHFVFFLYFSHFFIKKAYIFSFSIVYWNVAILKFCFFCMCFLLIWILQ